jgi:hypothetical protein
MKKVVLLTVLSLLATPAFAKDPVFVKSASVADKPVVQRDAQLGYVLLRADGPSSLHLMRIASPADQAAYDTMRQRALDKETKRYAERLKVYKQTVAVAGKTDSKEKPPVEPTSENFVFTPFGLLAGVSIGPMNRFAKAEGGRSLYLESLTPGDYRIYGPVTVVPGWAAAGTCFCMGSVKFTVKAGEVTDLGKLMLGGGLEPAQQNVEVDTRLKDWPIRPADYRAVGKLPNYFGVTLGRIGPMPGVIRYERDRIIDVKGGQESAPAVVAVAATAGQ